MKPFNLFYKLTLSLHSKSRCLKKKLGLAFGVSSDPPALTFKEENLIESVIDEYPPNFANFLK